MLLFREKCLKITTLVLRLIVFNEKNKNNASAQIILAELLIMRNVLVVEDNKGDFLLIKEAFSESSSDCHLWSVFDGESALSFLKRQETYQKVPRPDLILLDLGLPRMDGRAVLSEIRKDENLRTIPVVVFSSSEDPKDVEFTYEMGFSFYIKKPMEFGQLIKAVKSIDSYWSNISLPSSFQSK
jgi:two-component system, chemotaxis family, response regulator Rcp1